MPDSGVMRALPTALKLDYEDYRRLPNDGRRYELVDGALHVTPSPVTRHQRISITLAARLHDHVRRNALGIVLAAPIDVVLSRHDIVQPDLLFVSASRATLVAEKNIQGAPDLVVEILSEGRAHDLVTKRRLYARYGVSEYWIVDPSRKAVLVLRRSGRTRFFRAVATMRRTLRSPLLPDFSLDVRELWR